MRSPIHCAKANSIPPSIATEAGGLHLLLREASATMMIYPCCRAFAGQYLPMTAVLGGLLFVQPEGYAEAQRDVIRLSPDILALQEQVRMF